MVEIWGLGEDKGADCIFRSIQGPPPQIVTFDFLGKCHHSSGDLASSLLVESFQIGQF